MKVFVTGATGYIGSAIVRDLVNKGCEVRGLARSGQAAKKILAMGAQPSEGNLNDPDCIAGLSKKAEAIIHCGIDYADQPAARDKACVEAIIKAIRGTGKIFIYTSGIWVYGDTGERIANEKSPLNALTVSAWRPPIEEMVLHSAKDNIKAMVIRPGLVYGHDGGIPGEMVKQAREKGFVEIIGKGENYWSLVHVNDVARLYLLALESPLQGVVLNATSGNWMKLKEFAELLAIKAAVPGKVESVQIEEARKIKGPFADALMASQKIESPASKNLLGWSATEPSLSNAITARSV